jgi:hypothetical protein
MQHVSGSVSRHVDMKSNGPMLEFIAGTRVRLCESNNYKWNVTAAFFHVGEKLQTLAY